MNDMAFKSLNFEFLTGHRHELAALGAFAERYAHDDPSSALVKLRTYAEQVVQGIYQQHGLPKPIQPDLIGLLNNDSFRAIVPAVVLDKLHMLRINGNKAAHGTPVSRQLALGLLREAFDLGRWLVATFHDVPTGALPDYQDPPPELEDEGSKGQLKREKRAALEKLAAQEAQMQELLRALDEERERAQLAQLKAGELETLLAKGQATVSELAFDEETTRKRLIDAMLAEAGWNVGENGANTNEVTQEEPVKHQPTASGIGYSDYVLWNDDGTPLATLEVKKTSVNPELGRKQNELYANGLEKEYGQRPIIIYTNGFDTWIWDDKQGYPPRKLFGLYSKDSLQYLLYQREAKKDLASVQPNPAIAGRLYQLETLRRVTERFSNKFRKSLIVQATGTGKTRVAISLVDLLLRARWAKRVLFLCDRRELRKQAKNAFTDFLPGEPLTIVGARTAQDRQKRIYLATYPAMKQVFQTFDVGFFDLIIADESHRSIYNVYGDMFRYFDCMQIGLTATPVEFVARNTYRLFDCDDQNPTAYYPLDRGVQEGYLTPFEVISHTTKFLRAGIKYSHLNAEQRKQLEEDGEDPKLFDYEAEEVDKQVYNKDTNRVILRNLMENGIRDATGQRVGKSIIFARSHDHAVLLRELFDEMYPQFGGKLCQVIDNYDPRAEQLIDDFKGAGGNDQLTIAISVDMLDTGIDIPEILNLVFAKPVKSKVKFWQMIGRGTRLCPNLLGPGKDKKMFRIFDHWGNFDYFDMHYVPAEPTVSKSLMQQLFETRIDVAAAALAAPSLPDFKGMVELLLADIAALPGDSIPVKERWKEVKTASDAHILEAFNPQTVMLLRRDIAPLMQWVNIRGHADGYDLDLLVARMQIELLKKSGRFNDLKADLLNDLATLQMHLNPVRAKEAIIKEVKSTAFWDTVTVSDLERVRFQLRDIWRYRDRTGPTALPAKVVDIKEDRAEYEVNRRSASFKSIDMKAYEQQVEEALAQVMDSSPTLKKIRQGQPVTEADLNSLTSLVLTQNPDVNLTVLQEFYADSALPLDFILRSLVGMEPEVVKSRFETFAAKHPLTAKQTRFMGLLQNHIARHGSIELERLYDDPFTLIDSDGLEGVFDETAADELIEIIETFQPTLTATPTDGSPTGNLNA
jgi:type I restriction enzyme R subunit